VPARRADLGLSLPTFHSAFCRNPSRDRPDHMGFGKSETPRDRDYTLKTHVENWRGSSKPSICAILLSWPRIVAAPWPLPTRYATQNRVKRLFLLNTLSGYGRAGTGALTPWFQFIRKASRGRHLA